MQKNVSKYCKFGKKAVSLQAEMMSGEERANTWTHLVALIATLCVAWPLIRLSLHPAAGPVDPVNVIGTALFITGMTMMYLSSTLYHAATTPKIKHRLRVMDHISIYVMIAGSYSLVCMSVVGGWVGWSLFGFLWACVLVGSISKFFVLGRHPHMSLALYLMMGWVAILVIWPMWKNMPHSAFLWIVAEGVLYSIGAYFFSKDEDHAYFHAIWHVFIMLGSLSHTIATIYILNNIGL